MARRPATGKRARLRARRRIVGYGLLAVVGIALFAGVSVRAVVSAETDLRQVRKDDLVLAQVLSYRASLADVQAFVEPQFARLSPEPVVIDPVEIARGATLSTDQVARAKTAVDTLRTMGLNDSADRIQATSATFTNSLQGLGALIQGQPLPVIAASEATERAAYSQARVVSASAATRLRQASVRDTAASITHLANQRATLLTADAIAATFVLGGALFLGQRARRREKLVLAETTRHDFETTLQQALDMAKTEANAYSVVTEALEGTVPHLQVELLVADSGHARFRQVLHTVLDANEDARSGCAVESPLDCPATMLGHTMVFPTSRALNACPHLKGRPTGDLSAACVAVSLTGKTVGVVHATGADDQPPNADEVSNLEVTARRASERIAILRAFEKSEAQARTDPLTGLWNRRSLENQVHDLVADGTPYALAYGDLDHFKVLNDTHGHEAGDQALRMFARVLRESIRPGDFTARYGGEEFVVVLPECTMVTAMKILERLRERLALTLSASRIPVFTVSFGLAASGDADTFDAVVAVADQALFIAKANGRNRTVMAGDVTAPMSGELLDGPS